MLWLRYDINVSFVFPQVSCFSNHTMILHTTTMQHSMPKTIFSFSKIDNKKDSYLSDWSIYWHTRRLRPRLFNVLAQFLFATNGTTLLSSESEHKIVSRTTKRRPTQNFRKFHENPWNTWIWWLTSRLPKIVQNQE